LRILMSVLQEVYSAGGSVTFGRGNTNFPADVNQTRALIDNYVRQHHSAHFVGAVQVYQPARLHLPQLLPLCLQSVQIK